MAFIDEGGILGPGTHVVYLSENEERYSDKGNPYWKSTIKCVETQATRFLSFHTGFMRDILRALEIWQGPREYDATEVMFRPFTVKLAPGTHEGKAVVNVVEVSAPPEGLPEVIAEGAAPQAAPAQPAAEAAPAQPTAQQTKAPEGFPDEIPF